jgi:VIT1/CCC1 family predicted Fe2+/Mn2+ transporter
MRHDENHRTHRIGWLRAAVLGANDGIVTMASMILGVAATGAPTHAIVVAGVASLVAGAMSMAAGEYVSVSSQAGTERADLAKERHELATDPGHEHAELAAIYVGRGLDEMLAHDVATQLMAHDALGAHARDELGMSNIHTAQPIQAALASAATFALGAALPLACAVLAAWLVPSVSMIGVVAVASLFFLAVLGTLAAKAGGASVWISMLRVTLWGAFAMAVTAGIGMLFGVTV